MIAPSPCPFCGVDPLLVPVAVDYFIVRCDNDDCNVKPRTSGHRTAFAAVASWNRRPTEQTLSNDVARERLRAAVLEDEKREAEERYANLRKLIHSTLAEEAKDDRG